MDAAPAITLATGSRAEQETRDELVRLLSVYDVARWTYTRQVRIDERVIPHSHPVLTLGTFDRGAFLLSSYLHEQLHWFCVERDDAVGRCVDEQLRVRYPAVPADLPQGAGSESSTYLHLIVCWQELSSLAALVGDESARRVVERIGRHHYTYCYQTIAADFTDLGELYARYGLVP